MNKEAEEKETMECEKFLAGALLKFKTLDNVDFSLLVEDFEKKTNIEPRGLGYHSHIKLGKYIETIVNGTIKLRNGISFD